MGESSAPSPGPATNGLGRRVLGRTGLVGVGVVVNGAATFIMLAVVARGCSVETFAAVAAWWVMATLVAFPFGVFETLAARLVLGHLARRQDPRATMSTLVGRAGLVAAVVSLAAALLDPVLGERVFRGNAWLGLVLGAYAVTGAAQSLLRGHGVGSGRFDAVTLQMCADGALRTLLVTLAVVAFPDDVLVIVLAIWLGALGSLFVGSTRSGPWLARPRLRDPTVAVWPVAALLVGAVGPVLINNASVPWLSSLGAPAALVGAFSAALTLSRVPIQLSGAAFGPLLAEISHLVEQGTHERLRSVTVRTIGWAAALAAVFVLLFTALGPLAMKVFVGPGYDLPWWAFLVLSAATGTMLVAVVAQARLVAHQEWGLVAGSWIAAAVVFGVALLLPLSTLGRAATAPFLGSATALLVLAGFLVRREARGR